MQYTRQDKYTLCSINNTHSKKSKRVTDTLTPDKGIRINYKMSSTYKNEMQ